MCFVVLCLCITCVCFLLAPVGAIQNIARTRNVKFRQFGVFSNALLGVEKLFKNETLSFIFKVLFKGNTVALKKLFGSWQSQLPKCFPNALLGVGKLKSFLKNFGQHNNQMPPLNISQNVFTNYKRACFEYRKLLGCEL